MRAYVSAIYLFLYGPIALIVLFSFNAGRSAMTFSCCSLSWYPKTFDNALLIDALTNSLGIGLTVAVLATIMGTMAALALENVRGVVRTVFDALTYISIMIPGIVIGISTLIALVAVFDALNPVLAAVWPWGTKNAPRLGLGYGSIIAAHTLFTMALVIVVVRARLQGMDRSLIEASSDLYAPPWRTFVQVTLPQIMPGVLSGFLLAFTFSFDDFIIAFFVVGPRTTLPIYIFSSIKRGVTPETNVIATVVFIFSLSLLLLAQFMLRRRAAGGSAPQ